MLEQISKEDYYNNQYLEEQLEQEYQEQQQQELEEEYKVYLEEKTSYPYK